MPDISPPVSGKRESENARLRRLIQVAVDALDAEKTPDYGEGHDRAFRALREALDGRAPHDPFTGQSVPLDQIKTNRGQP